MEKNARPTAAPRLQFRPLTPDRWPDLERLFGERGACGGCWCMSWRLRRPEFDKNKGEGNKKALRKIVRSGAQPGILAYADGAPAGWCSIAPRTEFSFLERSRVLAPVDDQAVWSVTCFFVARPFRRKGVSVQLLKAAVALARRQGARMVEGYPQEIGARRDPDAFVWTGLASAFRKAGFKEVARRSKQRPIMRYFAG